METTVIVSSTGVTIDVSNTPVIIEIPNGINGIGVPAGGTTDQVLAKLSNTSYDTGWITVPLLDTANTWTDEQTFSYTVNLNGNVDLSAGTTTFNPGTILAVNGTLVLNPGTVIPPDGHVLTSSEADGTAVWAAPAPVAPTGAASGDLDGTYPSPTIALNAVTYAKMQVVEDTGVLLGRNEASIGNVETIGLGTGLTMTSGVIDVTGAPPTGAAGGSLAGTYPNPSLGSSVVGVSNINATGTPSGTTYLRGDGAWATVSAGAGTVTSITPAADNGSGTAITSSGTITVSGTASEITTSITGTNITVGLPDEVTVVDLNTERIDFDLTPTAPTDAVGRMYWDATYETVTLGLDAHVQQKIGQSLYKRGRNASNTTAIPKGAVVYISGSHALTELLVDLADADSELTSSTTVGVAAESISPNTTGFVQVFGYLTGLTTNGYSGLEGSALYLSSTPGEMQSTLPTQPKHGVRVGFIAKKAGAGAGSIFINIQNYQELEELSDVLISSPTNNDLLSWDSGLSVWKNRANPTITVDTQTFNASGTWTKPAGAVTVAIKMSGGGAGGNFGSTTTGGIGGGAGEGISETICADYLGATETVTIGAGGTGGIGAGVGGTPAAVSATIGNPSIFGSPEIKAWAFGGGYGLTPVLHGTSKQETPLFTALQWGRGGNAGSGAVGGRFSGGGGQGSVSLGAVGSAGGSTNSFAVIESVSSRATGNGGGGAGGIVGLSGANGGNGGAGTIGGNQFASGGGGGGAPANGFANAIGGTGGAGIRGSGGGGGGRSGTTAAGSNGGAGGTGFAVITTVCYT